MIYRFEDFKFDSDDSELLREGEIVPLAPQPAMLLGLLLQNAGRTVSREEIRRLLWGEGTYVEVDLGLNSCVRKIRAQLGDDPNESRFIRTIPRRGYRFVGKLEAKNLSTAAEPRSKRAYGAVAALLVVGSLLSWRLQERPDSSSPPSSWPKSSETLLIAVLPFANFTEDSKWQYAAEGLTEETITSLGRLDPKRLAVIARSTAMQLHSADKSLPDIAEELGLTYFVEGSLRKENGHIRATVRLVEGSSGAQVGVETYDISLTELLTAQTAVAAKVSEWLSTELGLDQPADFDRPEITETAYEKYLRGRYALNQGSPESYLLAQEHFSAVTAAAPQFAAGWAGLAESELWLHWFGTETSGRARERSRQAALTAIENDSQLADPHALLGYAAFYIDYDFRDARNHFENAVAAHPGSARGQSWLAAYLSAVGRHDEAIERARLARRLDPMTMAVQADLCWLLNYARRFEEAVEACSNALELDRNNFWTTLGKVEALRQLNREAEAVESLSLLLSERAPVDFWRSQAVANPAGALVESWNWLESWLGERATTGRPGWFHRASLAAVLNQHEDALDRLELALAARALLVVYLGVDPRFDEIRDKPRFQSLLNKIGIPETPESLNS